MLTLQNTFSPGYPALQSPEFLSRASSLRSHLREGARCRLPNKGNSNYRGEAPEKFKTSYLDVFSGYF